MKAHDVRHLTRCDICHGIADERHSVAYNVKRKPQKVHAHGRCYVMQFGIEKLLLQDDATLASLTLGDVGPETARAILDRHSPALSRIAG
jgi:hypothetical protein